MTNGLKLRLSIVYFNYEVFGFLSRVEIGDQTCTMAQRFSSSLGDPNPLFLFKDSDK